MVSEIPEERGRVKRGCQSEGEPSKGTPWPADGVKKRRERRLAESPQPHSKVGCFSLLLENQPYVVQREPRR